MRALARLLGLIVAVGACRSGRAIEAPVVVVEGADASAPMAIAAAPSSQPSASESAGLVGRWEGVGRQDDGFSWPMFVELSSTSPGPCATVEYPSVPCSGQWICARSRGDTIEARERLLGDSARRCIDGGAMTMEISPDGSLAWEWVGSDVTASATLRRAR